MNLNNKKKTIILGIGFIIAVITIVVFWPRNQGANDDRGTVVSGKRYISQHPAIIQQPLPPTKRGKLGGLTVFLDPGHGGPDGGTSWDVRGDKTSAYEAAVTYISAWELGNMLREEGAEVGFTAVSWFMIDGSARDGTWPKDAVTVNDRKPVLNQSTQIARRDRSKTQKRFGARFEYVNVMASRAEKRGQRSIAVSLHVDAYGSSRIVGGHTAYSNERGSELAAFIAEEMRKAGVQRRGTSAPIVENRKLAVLVKLRHPATLVEMGVPRNSRADYDRLMDEGPRRKFLKEVILAGIMAWWAQDREAGSG